MLEQVSYMDKFRRAGWVGLSVLRGQAADKRGSDRGWRVSRLSASVFIWPGMASGRRPVVQFSPSCQKLPNQENALGAPCLRCDFCSPPAPSRCAGMLRTDVAFDVTLAVAITKASRPQALMLFPVIGGRCTTKTSAGPDRAVLARRHRHVDPLLALWYGFWAASRASGRRFLW
jgi:hypothetical protein